MNKKVIMYIINLKKIFFLMICLIAFCGNIYSAMILTKDKIKYIGKISEENNENVTIIQEHNISVTIPKNNIERIDYTDAPDIVKSYPFFGFTLGTPGVINLVGGYMWPVLGIQVSGMFWGDIKGVQLNGLIKLGDYKNFMHSLALGVGYIDWNMLSTNAQKLTYFYGSLSYNLNFYGFFLEVGIGYGEGQSISYFSSQPLTAQFLFQFGYVHRFNKVQ